MRYLTLGEVVALHRAVVFGLAMNHPFVDGNKRIAHAAMAVFLELNGFSIEASVAEQERLMLDLAAGDVTREALTAWLAGHVIARLKSD
jgi:death-on-curing protein